MNVSIIAPGVHRSFGGPTKTIGSFKEALNAEFYSFCDTSRLNDDPLGVGAARVVPLSRVPYSKTIWLYLA